VTGTPGGAWAAAGCAILALLAIDLLVNRGQPGMRRAVLVSVAWLGADTVFGIVVTLWRGGAAGQEYFAAYLVEKALSTDHCGDSSPAGSFCHSHLLRSMTLAGPAWPAEPAHRRQPSRRP
jgi:hypothetical protein